MKSRHFMVVILIITISSIALLIYSFLGSKPTYRLDGLHPKVEKAKDQLIENSKKRGIEIKITQGIRSFGEQDQLYAQGRVKPGEIVTHAKGGQSFHNYGLAIDFVVIDPNTKNPTWDSQFDGNQNGKSDWIEVAEEGKKLGFKWGGDWQGLKDMPHLEMTFGQSIWRLYFDVKIRNLFT